MGSGSSEELEFELEFDDVVTCKEIADFHAFFRKFCAERKIVVPSEEARRYYWALFYRWKSSIKGVE